MTSQPMTITGNTMTSGATTVTPAFCLAPQPVAAGPSPTPSARDRVRARLQRLLGLGDFALPPDLPPIAGAAPEAETEKRVELTHKKKIILERKVGAKRADVKDGQETHKGRVELVRTLSGNENEIGTIGIKATGDSSGFVEVPLEDLLSAVEELRNSVPPKA